MILKKATLTVLRSRRRYCRWLVLASEDGFISAYQGHFEPTWFYFIFQWILFYILNGWFHVHLCLISNQLDFISCFNLMGLLEMGWGLSYICVCNGLTCAMCIIFQSNLIFFKLDFSEYPEGWPCCQSLTCQHDNKADLTVSQNPKILQTTKGGCR